MSPRRQATPELSAAEATESGQAEALAPPDGPGDSVVPDLASGTQQDTVSPNELALPKEPAPRAPRRGRLPGLARSTRAPATSPAPAGAAVSPGLAAAPPGTAPA